VIDRMFKMACILVTAATAAPGCSLLHAGMRPNSFDEIARITLSPGELRTHELVSLVADQEAIVGFSVEGESCRVPPTVSVQLTVEREDGVQIFSRTMDFADLTWMTAVGEKCRVFGYLRGGSVGRDAGGGDVINRPVYDGPDSARGTYFLPKASRKYRANVKVITAEERPGDKVFLSVMQ